MATFVMTDASLTVGGTDLSDHIKSITISYSAAEQDNTAMGATAMSRLGGLLDWSMEVEFYQDYAVGEIDATMFSLVGTSVALVAKPTSGSVSTTNPSYSGNGILTSYQPLGGAVGEIAMAPVSFVGNGALARATA